MRFSILPLILLALSFPVSPSLGQDESASKAPELTRDQRQKRADLMEKMAEMHTKMAQCLRSGRPLSECHEQMKRECPMAKEGRCPIMDERGGGHARGMHHRGHGKGAKKSTRGGND